MTTDERLPLPEGFHDGPPRPADLGRGGPPPGPLSGPFTLADLLGEYALFSPALLLTAGLMDVDLVQEYLDLTPAAPRVALLSLPRRAFAGMRACHPDPAAAVWDHTLLAASLDGWPGLKRHLATAAAHDRGRKRAWKAFLREVLVPDWLEDTSLEPCLVPVTVVGVAGSDGVWGPLPSRHQFLPLRVVRAPWPRPLARFLGDLLSRRANPHDLLTGAANA